MAMTNADRQRKFREQKRKSGLVKKDIWTDRAGLLSTAVNNGTWGSMTSKEFVKAIDKLYSGEDLQKVYAELFEYAKFAEYALKKALGVEKY